MEQLQYSESFIRKEVKSTFESSSSALTAALISYIYFGNDIAVNFYGFEIKPYLLVGIVVFISEMLNNQISMSLDYIGIDEKVKGLNELASPIYTGIGASLVIFLNRYLTTGSMQLNSIYVPFIIGFVASLIGSKINTAVYPTIDNLL